MRSRSQFRSLCGHVLIIMVVLIQTSPAHGETYVDTCKESTGPPDGNIPPGGIPYSTVADGVAAAPPDSIVMVLGSDDVTTRTYPETGHLPFVLNLNKRVEIRAEEGSAATIGQTVGTRKLWQLTGKYDLERHEETATQTEQYGLQGTDLGASFEHEGRIYFLFGDTWMTKFVDFFHYFRPLNSDSIAWIPADTDPEQPIKLNFITAYDGWYLPPAVFYPDGTVLPRAEFEVPISGFSANGKMYVFFSTDHKKVKDPQGNDRDYMGRTVLARLNNITENKFDYVYSASCVPGLVGACSGSSAGRFINIAPVVVNNADVPELLQAMGPGRGVLMWGTGLYRASHPYLAYLPLDKIEDPSAWRYAVVKDGSLARWSELEYDASPLFEQCGASGGMGELSVTWNPFLHKWLMLYGDCDPVGENYRTAEKPWGPWSPPNVLFHSFCDHGLCHFMHRGYHNPNLNFNEYHCDSVIDQPWPPPSDKPEDQPQNVWGGDYGPYVVSAFTRGDADSTTIYWLMSTWNPYQVVLMKSTLRLSDGLRVDQPRPPR